MQEQIDLNSIMIILTMKRFSIKILNDDNNHLDDHFNAEITIQRRLISSTSSTMTLISNLKRYKSKNIDYFHLNAKKIKKTENITFDIFVFIDRVKEVIALKTARLIQLNLRQNLRDEIAD